ncbi:MAG: SDR family NAD(P)-dependent oxidoreductase [Magnetococcales bacterium]|nr:SDR family NAD(P)-dependent oxidoreductase [Magnetococcales bacterium]
MAETETEARWTAPTATETPFPALSPGGVALVTGGGRRLGKTICKDLAQLGFRVGVVYHRSQKSAEESAAEINQAGGDAHPIFLNLADPTQIEDFLNESEYLLGKVPDLLIHNAALFQPTPVEDGSWDEMTSMIQVNLQGPLWLSLQTAQRMARHRGGQIITICDIWGERPLKGYTAYSATKAGLIMTTRSLARELAPAVRVNAIAPGAILPPDETTGQRAAAYHQLLAHTPLAGQADPSAVTHAIRYLLAAHYVTGEILHVDGGRQLL